MTVARSEIEDAHRSVTPEETLERALPRLSQFGITRLAVLTGLDSIGIPVAAAYRPNSRSIAVHQGKGRTLAAAKVSAIMEAVECWHAEAADIPLRWGSVKEIARHGQVVAVEHLPLAIEALPATVRFLWAQGSDLTSGGPIWVPYELVSADMTGSPPAGFGLFQQTTNGLGCGNTLTEAMLQGIYEVIERHSVAEWYAASRQQQAACCVDPATVRAPMSTWILQRFADASVAVRIWDVTTPIGVPAFVALACDEDGIAGIEPELGSGCHASADVALTRALVEAAQARVTRISGARDDFVPRSFTHLERTARDAVAARMLGVVPTRAFADKHRGATAENDLQDVLAALARRGYGPVVSVDLTRADIAIPVTRMVIPGLRGPLE